MKVVELSPGGGWYTEILANYLHEPGRPLNKRIIRETGIDYFDRYREVFDDVEIYDSESFDKSFNLTIDIENLDSDTSEGYIHHMPNLLPVCRA